MFGFGLVFKMNYTCGEYHPHYRNISLGVIFIDSVLIELFLKCKGLAWTSKDSKLLQPMIDKNIDCEPKQMFIFDRPWLETTQHVFVFSDVLLCHVSLYIEFV